MNYQNKSKEELIKEIEILKQRDEHISNVLYNIDEMFYRISFDKKGNKVIDYISPQVENVLGLTTEEYISRRDKLFEHFHPEELEELIKQGRKIPKNDKKQIFTYRFYHKKQNKYVWIEESIVRILDKKGKLIGLTGTARDITERKKTESQLSFILQNIDECIYNVKFEEDDKHLNYISKRVEELTGLTREEFMKEGKSGKLINRLHPDDVDMVNNHIEDGLYAKRKKQIKTEFRFKPKGKKEYIWLEETVHTSYNDQGKIAETTTVLRDVTEQKNYQDQLKLSEKSYKDLFDESPDLLYIQDKKGVFLDINKAVVKRYGYKRSEIIGKTPRLMGDPKKNDFKKIDEYHAKAWEGKKQTFEFYSRSKSGKEFIKEVSLRKAIYFGQDVIIASGKDITKSKTIEKHLKESEEKYRTIFAKNLAGVFITEKGKIIECNNSFAKIFGYKSRVELIGKPATTIYFSAKDRKQYIEELEKKGSLTNYRIRHKKKDGSEMWILTNVAKREGRIEGTLIEITEEIRQEELNKEKLRATIAEQSNEMLQKEIEERKKIERKLVENQKYTSSIINSSLDIICASDINGNIIEINNAGLKVFGYKEKEIMYQKASLFYADKKELVKVSTQLKKTGSYIGEVVNKRKNGEIFTCFLSAALLYDQDGKIIGSMGVSRDITELKEAEKQLIESEDKYKDLFENATDLIQSVDTQGKLLYVNNAWKKTMGYTDKELKDRNIFELIHPDCMDKCQQIFSEVLKNKPKENTAVSYELKTKKGEKITVEGNVSLKFEEGKPVSTRAILRDITEEIWDQTKQDVYNNISKIVTESVDQEELYEAVRAELGKVLYTDVFSISYVLEDDLITFPYYYDITRKGRIYPENRYGEYGANEYIINKAKAQLFYKEDWDKVIEKGKYKLYGKKSEVYIGVPLKIRNKVIGVLSVQSYNNRNDLDKNSLEILEHVSTAIALAVQRKFDEAKIYDQSARLQSIIENSTHLFWTFNKKLGLTTFNKNFEHYVKESYGLNIEQNLYRPDKTSRVSVNQEQDFWDDKYKEAYKGKQQHFVTDKKDNRGERIIKDVFLNPIFDDRGEVTEISGIAHDITEKTIAEEQLMESLKEKEVLLKEVHHRVKNNLQVISSILNLQSSYVKEESTLNILKESQNRIKSMAFIHESLYQTNDFSKINFSEYVISLSQNLVHSYGVFDNFVDLELKVKNVSLNLDQSIPCGLLINELVSNALKYAFPEKQKGTITLELFEKGDNIHLVVKDNGVGIPKNVNYRNTDSLGLQLVMTLTEQINGTIELDNTKGAKYSIKFKKDK